jgi:hypothetical protein
MSWLFWVIAGGFALWVLTPVLLIAAALFATTPEDTTRPSVAERRYPWEQQLEGCPRLLISYVDFEGNATEREITPKVMAGPAKNRPDRVMAYCHHRKAPREFVLSRIKAACDAGTGEVIPNIKSFIKLYAKAA